MYIVDNKSEIAGFYVNDTECRELDKNTLDSIIGASKKVSDSFGEQTTDSAEGLSKKFKDLGLVTYMLETTSDKEINGRSYATPSVESSAVDGWTKPYPKPIMEDHIINSNWGDSPNLLGRTGDSYFVRRDTGKVTKGTNDKLPLAVKNHFLKLEDKGTGFCVLKIDLNDRGIKSLKDGELKTFSQGSIYRKGDCNICGNDYTDDECNHRMGKVYEIDGKQIKCVPVLSDRTPIEASKVYHPANDTSQKIVYNTKTGKILSDEEVISLLDGSSTSDSNNDNSNTNPDTETNDNSDFSEGSTNDNEGGKTVSKALKNAVIDAAEARLEKNFTDEFIEEFTKVADEAKTDAELDLVVKFAKLFGKMDCAKTINNFPTATEKESKDNEEDSTVADVSTSTAETEVALDTTGMTAEAKAAVEKIQKDLKDANDKLAKFNDSESNKPFSTKTTTDTDTEELPTSDKDASPQELNIFNLGI